MFNFFKKNQRLSDLLFPIIAIFFWLVFFRWSWKIIWWTIVEWTIVWQESQISQYKEYHKNTNSTNNRKEIVYKSVIKFTCNRKEIIDSPSWFSSSKADIWDKKIIRCNWDTYYIPWPIILNIVWPLFLLWLIYLWLRNIYRTYKLFLLSKKLRIEWIKEDCIIKEVIYTWNISFNKRWYKIVAERNDSIFESEIIYHKKVNTIFKKWEQIDILINPIDSSEYLILREEKISPTIPSDWQ